MSSAFAPLRANEMPSSNSRAALPMPVSTTPPRRSASDGTIAGPNSTSTVPANRLAPAPSAHGTPRASMRAAPSTIVASVTASAASHSARICSRSVAPRESCASSTLLQYSPNIHASSAANASHDAASSRTRRTISAPNVETPFPMHPPCQSTPPMIPHCRTVAPTNSFRPRSRPCLRTVTQEHRVSQNAHAHVIRCARTLRILAAVNERLPSFQFASALPP